VIVVFFTPVESAEGSTAKRAGDSIKDELA